MAHRESYRTQFSIGREDYHMQHLRGTHPLLPCPFHAR